MTTRIYTNKAQKYDRYRWEYVPGAFETIMRAAGINASSVVVDLGAGTGRAACHFAGSAGQIIALEPNRAMLSFCRAALADAPGTGCIQACAEASGLRAGCADLITVGQAIHWFDPLPAREEIRRISKPGGWLALLRNYSPPSPSGEALAAIATPENGVLPNHPAPGIHTPPEFYFGPAGSQVFTYPFAYTQDWPAFLGSLTSASYMPDEDHPLFPRLEAAARAVFLRFAETGADGVVRLRGSGFTELRMGPVF